MRYFFIILACASLTPLRAQNDSISEKPADVRAKYIRSYPEDFFIWPVLKQRKLDFELKSLTDSRRTLQYKSNRPYSLGIGLYLFEIGAEITFAIPLDEKSKEIYGESDAQDLTLSIIGKKWGADLFYRRYTGFYIDDPDVVLPSNTPRVQRPDISSRDIGITVNRIFSHNKFSFRSAYSFAERQLSSSGSVIVFASFENLTTKGDSAVIGTRYLNDFGESAGINNIVSNNLAVAPGYSYSLIFKGFFINGTLAVGPANNWMKYDREDGSERNALRMSVFVAARIAIGYNGDKFFGGLTFTNQGRNVKFDNLEISSSQSAFKILMGIRLGERGILKKRAWDVPEKILN